MTRLTVRQASLAFATLGFISGIILGLYQLTHAATIPQGGALFETSLQDRITSTDSSMTLVANSLRGSEALSGYNCFTIDEGRTDQEFVCGTVSGTSVTSLTRGISFLNGTSTVSANKYAHRKGADVKVTDYPSLIILQRILAGIDNLGSIFKYDSSITTSSFNDAQQIVDKGYADNLAFNGASVVNATAAAKGVVQLANGLQAASSTATGSTGANLVLPTTIATDTPNSGTNTSVVIMSDLTGHLKQAWLDLTKAFTVTGNWIFGGTATFNGGVTVATSSTISNNIATLLVASTSPFTLTNPAATTTAYTYTINANTLGASDLMKITAFCLDNAGSASDGCEMQIGNGSATTTLTSIGSGLGSNIPVRLTATVYNANATNAQFFFGETTSATLRTLTSGSTSLDTTGKLFIAFRLKDGAGSGTMSFQGITIEKL
jgi:hypothetical protein